MTIATLEQQKSRRAWQDFKKFASLVAAPGNLATGVTLPANAQLFVSTTSVLAANTVLVTLKNVDKTSPPAAANAYDGIGYGYRGSVVIKKAGAPGTVSAYVRDPMGKLRKIAQG